MKNRENAERPVSSMAWVAGAGPSRRPGRPAQAVFSFAIRESRAFTGRSNRKSNRAAGQNHRIDGGYAENASGCCILDSVRTGEEANRRSVARCSHLEPLNQTFRTCLIGNPPLFRRDSNFNFSPPEGRARGARSISPVRASGLVPSSRNSENA